MKPLQARIRKCKPEDLAGWLNTHPPGGGYPEAV
jgi:hypothetical protein